MKRIAVIVLALLCLVPTGAMAADYLACIVQPNIKASEVKIDGNVMPGIVAPNSDGTKLLLYDISNLGSGPHTFDARLQDSSGWWGAWSVNPLDASRPEGATLEIVSE